MGGGGVRTLRGVRPRRGGATQVFVCVAVALRAPISRGAQKASWRIDLKKGVKGARREKFDKEYYKLD